jgi:hypothetical protein
MGFIFAGNKTLIEQGYREGHVVSVFVFDETGW